MVLTLWVSSILSLKRTWNIRRKDGAHSLNGDHQSPVFLNATDIPFGTLELAVGHPYAVALMELGGVVVIFDAFSPAEVTSMKVFISSSGMTSGILFISSSRV